MNTEMIRINSYGDGMREALEATERLGVEGGLTPKQTLRLRLLAEELFGMMRSIVGEMEADYRVERAYQDYTIRMKSEVIMTQELRRQLIAVSTQGENAAAIGFMGKLRDMIGAALLPKSDSPSMLTLGLMSMGSPGGYSAGSASYDWSLVKYKSGLKESGAADAWDELEKSIVANIADEVSIRIKGSVVEIIISKTF